MFLEYLFWFFLAIVIYVYILYIILLFIVNIFKNLTGKEVIKTQPKDYPEVTMITAVYNEKDCLHEKINNLKALNYPNEKLKYLFVSDGSDDGSDKILQSYTDIQFFHQSERKGKINAINRILKFIKTPYVVFSDANTLLNENAVKELIVLFKDRKVGCVAGEKRIMVNNLDYAVNSGEGFYWKYESWLKNLESKTGSTIAAAGELFAARTKLLEEVETDTILDDFVISMNIIKKKYKIKYTSKAFATERGSASIKDELKRKKRIASGAYQAVFRNLNLLNIFKYGFFSFKYFSHKILRWMVVPYAFIGLFVTNCLLVVNHCIFNLYSIMFGIQLFFYFLVFMGFLFRNKKIRYQLFFIPFYAFIMNYAIIAGMFRYIKGNYSVNWEKAQRG